LPLWQWKLGRPAAYLESKNCQDLDREC
jgi:hypothetical protein